MDDLFSLIPVIKRARGYRLYAFSGRRFLDLYLSGGHALLGHKPPQLINSLKQACERGVLSDLPSIYARRLLVGLRSLFPDYKSFFLAASLPELLERAGRALGRPLKQADISDPLLPGPAAVVTVWRPFTPAPASGELLLPVIPSGLAPGLQVLCSRQPGKGTGAPVTAAGISALALAAAAHGLKLLAAAALPDWYSPDLLKDSPHFEQQGLYLVPRCSADAYPRLFKRFLEKGLVLSPQYPEPSILPLELSPGELQNIRASFMTEGEGAP